MIKNKCIDVSVAVKRRTYTVIKTNPSVPISYSNDGFFFQAFPNKRFSPENYVCTCLQMTNLIVFVYGYRIFGLPSDKAIRKKGLKIIRQRIVAFARTVAMSDVFRIGLSTSRDFSRILSRRHEVCCETALGLVFRYLV